MKVKVAVSARHIHLTKEMYECLFDEPLTKRNDLNQLGQFASNQVVTIKTNKDVINNVRILGPFRSYNQVEISRTDAIKLGINPPIRKSGDLVNSPDIIVIGPKGSITLSEAVIIPERHIHITRELEQKYNLINNSLKTVTIDGTKGMHKKEVSENIIATLKISDDAFYEMHIDTDDANALGLKTGDEVDVNL